MTNKKLMIDPTPAGWAFGFPKALPEENFQYYKTWVEPKDPGHPEYDPDIHGGGVESFK